MVNYRVILISLGAGILIILITTILHQWIKQNKETLTSELSEIKDEMAAIRQWIKVMRQQYPDKDQRTKEIKDAFEDIYKYKRWSAEGRGSGLGSSVNYTSSTRETLFTVIKRFNLTSLLDLSCGGMLWMPIFLRNISTIIPNFKFKGLDITESNIASHRKEFANMPNWSFEFSDFTSYPLPTNWDLVLVRDTIQHLPFPTIIQAVQNIANTLGLKYLLITSVPSVAKNGAGNIKVGSFHDLNLKIFPFNLSNTTAEFVEGGHGKYLNLYDIQNYLKRLKF